MTDCTIISNTMYYSVGKNIRLKFFSKILNGKHSNLPTPGRANLSFSGVCSPHLGGPRTCAIGLSCRYVRKYTDSYWVEYPYLSLTVIYLVLANQFNDYLLDRLIVPRSNHLMSRPMIPAWINRRNPQIKLKSLYKFRITVVPSFNLAPIDKRLTVLS